MINTKEGNSSNFSSSINKDQTSKAEEDDELFSKARPRMGLKNKMNNNQVGRTVSVPLSSFSGISHNASFQSKILFFNGGKPRKFQHIPYASEKTPEDKKQKTNKIDKKEEKKVEKKTEKKIEKKEEKKEEKKVEKKIEKKIEKKEEKKEEKKIEKNIDSNINIDTNLNINQILNTEKKNQNIKDKINNNEENKKKILINEEDDEDDIQINFPKKNTIYVPFNRSSTLSLDYKIPGFSKIQKEEKTGTKEESKINKINKLKSLDEQWNFQKILLDYNILDFTSKFYYF
jgi:hypothetical protein